MARLNFDPRQVEPNQVFEPLPTSWYTGQIVESDSKRTANNNGSFLELKVQVLGGDYNNRTVFDRLNLDNPNQQAVDIAYRTLSAICHAVGLGQQEVEDSQMLHGRPFLFKVNERPARTDPQTGTRYEAGNEIKGYKAIDPTAPPVLGPSKAQQRPFGGAPNGPAGMPQGFPGARPQGPLATTGAAPGVVNGGSPPNGWGNQQANPQFQQPAQQPAQQQPAQYAQANAPQFQQPQQQPVQPQGNVGNPALAQGTPPPWAQPQGQQPVVNGAPGSSPPWQK
jgi:Protein of unknown function (DUF669)